ncbi:MAG: glycine--tRNA ligase subunit beta [Candidatus Eisenbacteria bacterium]|uniref:Glycine--tRNA ligase beta subunit n=1 Tax=Eiseniibacteriota bacterium TaxID=2212470 RepID=A0A538U5F9_UNCEI|nr:MAG: glycine--tRNA ligase subunit beta [Candidatus Eisenbacteria bacterium]
MAGPEGASGRVRGRQRQGRGARGRRSGRRFGARGRGRIEGEGCRVSHELLFEIGAEEIPPSYVLPALEQLERGMRAGLAELRLEFDRVLVHGAPRRLAVAVTGLAGRQPDRDEEVTGPQWSAAFDGAGRPTRALLGFCQGRGMDPKAARKVTTPRGEYVGLTVHHAGKPALEVLPALLARLATGLLFPKSMRWLDDDTRFARPVRWLTALLDADVVPVEAFGLTAGRESFGHRFLARGPVTLAHARDYLPALERAFVLADHRRRRERIERQVTALAAATGGAVHRDAELIEINTFLAEWPTPFSGDFDPRYVDLPNEVIVTALREHQKFFAVVRSAGSDALLPHFVAVRDGDERGLDLVRRGNQAVLTARLEDAEFYWRTDLERGIDRQIESLGGWLAERLAPDAANAVRRAALLCKVDLLGEMIGSGKEYASLEGIMGGHYARRAGEPEAVAAAIAEHYRPRGGGDALPATGAGALLALADKLDHVAGAFVAGKIPKGSEDPYGVRRAGNGVIRILMDRELRLDLYATSMESTRILFANDPNLPHAEIMRRLGEFWRGRIETGLDERGIAYDLREATLEARPIAADGRSRPGWIDPCEALDRARVLAAFRSDARFEPLAILFKRVSNILKAATEPLPGAFDRAAMREPAEHELVTALERARAKTDPLWERRSYAEILPALLEMEQAIHTFFDRVLVNAEDTATRLNRLQLLSKVRALFLRGWDVSKVVVEGERVTGASTLTTSA